MDARPPAVRADPYGKVTLANNIATSRTYDGAGRETVIENRTSAGTALSVYSATYDNMGNRLTVQELDGTRVTYSYDSTCQLTNERRSGANAYNVTLSFDPLGNRLVMSSGNQLTTFTNNSANELTLIVNPTGAPTTNSFDANGNLTLANTGGALTTYGWDSENRLLTVSDSTGIVTSTYSAEGLRQKKVSGAVTSNYLWDDNNIVQESNAILVVQVGYTDLPGIPYGPNGWGGLFSVHQSGGSSFYVPDHQGTTRQLANASQTVTDTLLCDAWGREVASTGTTVNPFRYEGQYGLFRDVATRLNAQQRHLDVVNGRWLGRDPTWQVGANRFAYVSNLPTMYVDPTGLDAMGVGAGIAAGVAAGATQIVNPSAPSFPTMNAAAAAWCKKLFVTGVTFEMCCCIVPSNSGGKPSYSWGNCGGDEEGHCLEAGGCPPGSGSVHTHPFPPGKPPHWPRTGLSKGDRWWCEVKQRPIYVCSTDSTVRKIVPRTRPGAAGPPPAGQTGHNWGEPGTIVGKF